MEIFIKIKENKDKVKKIVNNIKFMFRYSWNTAKNRYIFSVAYIILNVCQPFFVMIVPKYIIDELTETKRWNVFINLLVLLIIGNIVFACIRLVLSYFNRKSAMKTYAKYSMFYSKIWATMDYETLEDAKALDLMGLAAENAHPVHFIDSVISGLVTNIIQLAGYVYIVSSLHPLMIVVILVISLLSSQVTKIREKLGYKVQPFFVNMQRKLTYLFKSMIRLDHAKEVRINNASEWIEEKYAIVGNESTNLFRSYQKKQLKLNLVDCLLSFLQICTLYGYSAYRLFLGQVTLGSFQLYLNAVSFFTSSIKELISRFHSLATLSKYVDDYKKCRNLTTPLYEKQKICSPVERTSHESKIEFVNVSFKYPNTQKYALKNVSIRIKTGERLSVVGYNGAGKTTFIKLICRLYEPTEGKILFNGQDISELNYDDYREKISVVFQDFAMFDFSIQENIVLNRRLDIDLLKRSVQDSGLSGKLSELKNGLDTVIGKNLFADGVDLSGGETQKVASARAYYKNADVVILDEPTAALDPIAENQLYERFNNIITNKTAIYISHRLASVRFCDTIAVFCDGIIAEMGTFQELMSQNGIFTDMYLKQSQYYVEDATNEN